MNNEERQLEAYKQKKIKMLKDDFFIKLTKQDIKQINAQKTEMMVDSVGHCIIMDRL